MKNGMKWLLIALAAVWVFGACNKSNNPVPDGGNDQGMGGEGDGVVTYIYMAQVDANIASDAGSGLDELEANCDPFYRAVAAVNFDKESRQKMGLKGTIYYSYAGGAGKLIRESNGIDKLGETSDKLTEMIDLAVETAPATRYVLVFNGHGGGWDNTDARDPLTRSTLMGDAEMGEGITLGRIREGIRNSKLGKTGGKIDLIYFDACLMGTAEYMCDLGDVAEYAIASTTLSWTAEQKISTLIKQMQQSGDIEVVIRKFCENALQSWGKDGVYNILNGIRLDKMDAVAKAVGAISDYLIDICTKSDATLNAVRGVRSETMAFWYADDSSWPLYDLEDYLFRIRQLLQDPVYDKLYADYAIASAQALVCSGASIPENPHKRAGKLAGGNTSFSFSSIISSVDAQGNSPYFGTAYETLKMETVGKWLTFQRFINTTDNRLADDDF